MFPRPSLNVKRCLQLAEALDNHELLKKGIGFNMGTYGSKANGKQDAEGHPCKTVACIAGHALAIWAPKDWAKIISGEDVRFSESEAAAKILGIEEGHIASRLFTSTTRTDIPPWRAAAVLRRLAKTGRVEWDAFTTRNHEMG